jgi:hypothetical protein
MGISTNQQRIYFFAGYLRLAMEKGRTTDDFRMNSMKDVG